MKKTLCSLKDVFSIVFKVDILQFNEIENKYEQGALNCWIAALMYVATLCVSVQQFWMNERIVEIKAERM